MDDRPAPFLYPRKFEIFRLEALGEEPYLDEADARSDYVQGQGLSVIPEGRPPAWFIQVSTKRFRFTVTYYASTTTPLRQATWERDGEGLLCRRMIDLFYPDGDPGRFVPFSHIISVTRQVSADGVISSTLESPTGEDEFRETASVSVDAFRLPEPVFGDWRPLVEAEDVSEHGRFDVDAIDTALTALDGVPGEATGEVSGWRVPASPSGVLAAMDDVLDGRSPRSGVPVLVRGAGHILPLAVQADPGSGGRTAAEELRRMSALAADLDGGLEYRAGRAVAFDLTYRGADSVAAYAAALRTAGASRVHVWDFGQDAGSALVWTGDERQAALALHVVPSSWLTERRAGIPSYGIDVEWSAADIMQ